MSGEQANGADEGENETLTIGGRFEEFLPLRLVERGEGHIVLEVAFEPDHLNAAGMVHGGFVMSALDVTLAGAAAASPSHPEPLYGITLSMTTNFLGPVPAGRVRCVGTVTGGGRKTKFADARMEAAHGEPPEVYASATGTLRVIVLAPNETGSDCAP